MAESYPSVSTCSRSASSIAVSSQQLHQRRAGHWLLDDVARRRCRAGADALGRTRRCRLAQPGVARHGAPVRHAKQRQRACGFGVHRLVHRHYQRVIGIIRAQALEHVRQRFDDDSRTGMLGHEPIQAVEADAVVGADLHELEAGAAVCAPATRSSRCEARDPLDAVAGRCSSVFSSFLTVSDR